MAAYERQVRAAERQAEFEHWLTLNQQMLALAFVHKEEFPAVTKPIAPTPTAVDEAAILARRTAEATAGIPFWKRAARREARSRAQNDAAAETAAEKDRRALEHADMQSKLDRDWQLLVANEEHAVLEALEAAFEDNEMPAAPMSVGHDGASVLMKIGGPAELIPEREVTRTPTGKPTHRRRPKGTINALYAEILASHVVATVREGFAVAPGLKHIRVLAIRGDRLGGGLQLIPLYAGEFDRESMDRGDWDDVNVLGLIEAHGAIRYKGQAQEVAPLPTKTDLELRASVDAVAAQLSWKPAP
jgi:hypothetical protein